MILLVASNSNLIDSSKEILGARVIKGVIEPSCITGINAFPKNIKTMMLAPKAYIDRLTTACGLAKDQLKQ